jgi:hypothetical protein
VVVGLFTSWTGRIYWALRGDRQTSGGGDSYEISKNGKRTLNQKETLTVLRSFGVSPAHHSEPIHAIDVQVSYGSEHLSLRLARDSGDLKEYWVFFPKYAITSKNEIGRIKTSAFDNY